jgi:hypothetical protein
MTTDTIAEQVSNMSLTQVGAAVLPESPTFVSSTSSPSNSPQIWHKPSTLHANG